MVNLRFSGVMGGTIKKLAASLEEILVLLHDEKPTIVRKCLEVLHEVSK